MDKPIRFELSVSSFGYMVNIPNLFANAGIDRLAVREDRTTEADVEAVRDLLVKLGIHCRPNLTRELLALVFSEEASRV